MESILISVKEMLGISSDDEHFDKTIIMHINAVFMTLNQLGVGPDKPVFITDKMDSWEEALGGTDDIEAVKTYVYLKVRLLFDPPASSFVLDAMNKQATELEWRLNVQIENKEE